MNDLSLVTWNAKGSRRLVRAKLRSFRRRGAKVVCLQEVRNRHAVVRAGLPRWPVVGFEPNPIAVLPGLHVADVEVVFATPATDVGPEGAGPRVLREKRLTAVLVVVDGRLTWVVNLHAAPSIYLPERDDLHEDQMAALADFADAHPRHDVVAVGDFNAEWRHPNLDVLRAAGFRDVGPAGWTHRRGKRRIDLVLYRPSTRVRAGVAEPLRAKRARRLWGVVRWDHRPVHVVLGR